MQTPDSINRYVWIAAAGYFVISIALSGALTLLGLRSNVSLHAATSLAASMLAAWRFVVERQRLPEKPEKHQFALRTATLIAVVSLILIAVIALAFDIPGLTDTGMFLIIMLGVVAVLSFITYWILRWSFGWFASQQRNARRR
ncbi:ABZJ_00895 family protein [Chitinolyticbacter meiyuanensis]|uniref:ABZJ_00895 family protein n=1 Tax=Chitinolyticbacter meiyuanensis TaxID=682798 RepID=UPI0011E5EFF2|nr:ABZJ_00895 family protein [Chitinolyticbacter meiyuanensis]